MATSHEWHAGELFVQSQLGYKDAVAGAHPIFRPQLNVQHQQFYTDLSILPVCTLDARGRPWGSFLAAKDGQHGFIQSPSFTSLIATQLSLHQDHPVEMALREGAKFGMTQLVRGDDHSYQGPGLKLIAGVGVMFENRRRNKFAGFINERNIGTESERTIQVEVMESLGNCPKYINTRTLIPHPDYNPVVVHKALDLAPGDLLPEETRRHIARSDALFLATRYTSLVHTIFKSHLGINIRGGKPGFLRITTELVANARGEKGQRQVAYLPDYSGNRFMSSLGNIHSDKVAGVTVPLMQKGKPIDVVYLTGDAEVLIGQESMRVFPGVNTCVRIELTGYLHVHDAVPLMPASFILGDGVEDSEDKGEDAIGWSPYNPPVRRLRSELASLHPGPNADVSLEAPANEASIIDFEEHTSDLATITFRLSHPVKYHAGQHVILDCGSLLDAEVKEYRHMADKYGGERELNDTGLRTWTISSAPRCSNIAEHELKVSMRRVETGLITPKLFDVAKKAKEGKLEVMLPVLGVGGDFVLPSVGSGGRTVLWVASGVGVTPFLAFLQALANSKESGWEITMILAVRRAEAAPMLQLVRKAIAADSAASPASRYPVGDLNLYIVSAGLEDQDNLTESEVFPATFHVSVTRHSVRLSPELLLSIASEGPTDDKREMEAWVCGPPSLEASVLRTLEKAGTLTSKVHHESFSF